MNRRPVILLLALFQAATFAMSAARAEESGSESEGRLSSPPPGAPADDADRGRWRVAERDPLRGFEEGAEGWKVYTEEGLEDAVTTEAWASEGKRSLVVPVTFPGSATLYKRSTIGDFRWVTVDVRVPEDAPRGVSASWFFKDKDGHWFDQILTAKPFLPGETRTLGIDIRGLTAPMNPKGHLAAWSELAAADVETMGLMLICPGQYRGELYVDNLRGWTLEGDDLRRLALANFRAPAGAIPQHGVFEVSFGLTRDFPNPFDPEQISVEACFSPPGKDPVITSGFYHQEYRRQKGPQGEVLVPFGPAEWRARYCPTEPGKYSYFIEVTSGEDRYTSPVSTFTCSKSEHPGFVRVSKKDPYCFELDSGEWFFPIGHNFRSPTDSRCSQILGRDTPPDEGTFIYDRILPKMAAAGENFVEIWMSSWWLGLEWRRSWKGYRGVGRYNLENAWKLDYVLRAARKAGLRVHLVIDNHGKYSTWCDQEWVDSPYNWRNRRSGGFLSCPEEFFGRSARKQPLSGKALERHKKAWKLYQRKIRYIMARWGWDPTISGFEIISELDLTGSRGGFGVTEGPREWHRKAIDYIRSQDTNKHLLTTHYCGDFTNTDVEMAKMKGIEYVVGDAYRNDHEPFARLALLTDLGRKGDRPHPGWSTYRKPFMITEYGGSPFGTAEEGLIADLHCGLWSSYMTRAAGTPLLWWFELIDRRDLYSCYTALARFHEGEDRRGKKLQPRALRPEGPAKLALEGMVLTNGREGYAWVYSRAPMAQMPEEAVKCAGVGLPIDGLADGKYDVEIWDTYAGRIVSTSRIAAQGGRLMIALPEFPNDCAVKFRHAAIVPRASRAGTGPQGTSAPAPATGRRAR